MKYKKLIIEGPPPITSENHQGMAVKPYNPDKVTFLVCASFVLCLSLFGCVPSSVFLHGAELTVAADDGNIVDSGDGTAILYLYRPWRFGSGLAVPLIYLNGQKVVLLNNHSRVVLTLKEGGFIIASAFSEYWVMGEERTVWFVAQAGHTYYLRVLPSTGLGTTTFHFDFVPRSKALGDLESANLLQAEQQIYAGVGHIRTSLRAPD